MTPPTLWDQALAQLDRGAQRLGLEPYIVERLRHPKRILEVSVPVRRDDGSVKVFRGYRVQHNVDRGPAKGGIRYHPDVSLDDVAEATHLVSAALEDSDAMGEAPYTLEVSSYGVSRPLVERRHYARNVGRLVTFRGEGEPVTGRIRSVDRAALTIEVPAHGKTPARTDTLDLATIREGVVQIEFNRPDEESTGEDEEH